jgi:hypothetical protein
MCRRRWAHGSVCAPGRSQRARRCAPGLADRIAKSAQNKKPKETFSFERLPDLSLIWISALD